MSLKCICLHGFGENKQIYSLFVNEMAKIMPTRAIDLIGHGDYRCSEYHLKEVLDYLDTEIEKEASDVILVGTSFGGILSYIMSSNAQKLKSHERIKGIIINDVPCCIPKKSFTNLVKNLMALADKQYESLDELDQDYEENGFKLDRIPISDEHWQHFLEASLVNGKVNYDSKFFETLLSSDRGITTLAEGVDFQTMPDGSDALDLRYYYDKITKPILVFIGSRTTFFPPHIYDFMGAHPTTRKIVIQNGGHFLDLARPEIMDHIRQWVEQNSLLL